MIEQPRLLPLTSVLALESSCAGFIVNGKLAVESGGTHKIYLPKTVFWMEKGSVRPLTQRTKISLIPIPGEAVRPLIESQCALIDTRHGRPIHVASKLLAELQSPEPETDLVIQGLQYELGGYLARLARKSNSQRPDWLTEVLAYIQANLTRPLSLRELSDIVDIPPRRLSAAIQREFGTSFREFLIRKRLDHACRLLIETNLGIGEIAARSGFSDHSHLTREFRKIIGVPPSEYTRID